MISTDKPVSIIVAVAENNAIGYRNELLCHLPADLKYFKRVTSGHTVVMGRGPGSRCPAGRCRAGRTSL